VVAVVQGSSILVLGGGTTDVTSLGAANPSWNASVSADPSLDLARVSPGAGVLPDSTVLVFGGRGNGTAYASATQYMPVGTFPDSDGSHTQGVASMNASRVLAGSATDENHLIYAIGGIGVNANADGDRQGPDQPLASVEYFNQTSGTWQSVASLPQTLYSESAVGDGAGHIFTFGGVDATGQITSTVYRYTIATNTWDTVASLPLAVRDSAAVLAPNGLIYVLGGRTATGATAAVESYNETTNTWNTEPSLSAAVSSEAAAVDSLGRIEVLGGFDAADHPTAAVWISQQLGQPDAAPVITSSAPTSAATGKPYRYQVFSTGNPQATYALTAAPAGMTINSATGLITWTPTATQLGSYTVTVQASNFAGQTSQTYTVTVRQSAPTVPTNLHVTAISGTSISLAWNASSDPTGIAGYKVYRVTTFSRSGRGGGTTTVYTLLATTTGTSATVTGLVSGGSYTLVVAAYDSANLVSGYSKSVVQVTSDVPIVSSSAGTFVTEYQGQSNSFTLSALGNPTSFTFSVVNGPSGMTVDPTTGVVTWTPDISFIYTNHTYTFQATNSAGTGSLAISIYVAAPPAPALPAPTFTSPNLSGGIVYAAINQAATLQLKDSNNTSVTWSLVSGPAGLTVNPTTGAVTWTPPAGLLPGTYFATFQATNSAGSVNVTVPLLLEFASAPTNFVASNLNSAAGSAVLSWSAPQTNASPISGYRITVSYNTGSGVQTFTYVVSGTANQFTLTGLPTGTAIQVSIAALDSVGDLGMASSLTFSL
jgi:hypothetical protein